MYNRKMVVQTKGSAAPAVTLRAAATSAGIAPHDNIGRTLLCESFPVRRHTSSDGREGARKQMIRVAVAEAVKAIRQSLANESASE